MQLIIERIGFLINSAPPGLEQTSGRCLDWFAVLNPWKIQQACLRTGGIWQHVLSSNRSWLYEKVLNIRDPGGNNLD